MYFFIFLFYFKKKFLYADSEDPDQPAPSAVSDFGMHRLPIFCLPSFQSYCHYLEGLCILGKLC